MKMYLYTIERELSSNYTMNDIQELNKLITNSDNIHHLLGKLFRVEKEKNFRSIYNILYKIDDSTTFKLIIKSDKEIDKKQITDNKFRLLSEKEITIKNNDELTIDIDVAPFRKDGGKAKKKIIKTADERIAWLKNKFTYNNECIIKSIKENHPVMRYMEHKDKSNGSTMMTGYNYTITIKVKDTDKFTELVQKGVGPQKTYGFGLMTW